MNKMQNIGFSPTSDKKERTLTEFQDSFWQTYTLVFRGIYIIMILFTSEDTSFLVSLFYGHLSLRKSNVSFSISSHICPSKNKHWETMNSPCWQIPIEVSVWTSATSAQ